MPSRRHAPQAGFTLVEVLVAVAVVAITLAAGLKAAGALTDNAQRLGDIVNAQWCADNALTNLRLGKQFPGVGDTEFSCNQMGRDYQGAVTSSGFAGFMLGTTANAMANMEALVERYGPAPRTFLVVPMVGAFFIDFTNALLIQGCLNVFS